MENRVSAVPCQTFRFVGEPDLRTQYHAILLVKKCATLFTAGCPRSDVHCGETTRVTPPGTVICEVM